MKNCMICITLLLCISAGSSAQFIYNPANTPGVGNGNAWPFNLHTGWRFQFIIDKKVLGGGPLLISDIAFSGYYSPAKTFSVPDFQMRMGHTTYSNFGSSSANPLFDNVLGPTPTEVYTRGAIKWVCNYQAWSDIGLTNSFAYNGNDNICVEIRYNTTTSGGVTIITDPGISRAYTHTSYSNDPFNDPKWYVPIPGEWMSPIHRLTVKRGLILDADDTVQVGKAATVTLKTGTAGDYYQVAASLSTLPVNLGKCILHLTPDDLFWVSIQVGPPLFTRYAGKLDTTGGGSARLGVPNLPSLAGVIVYHAAIAYDLTGITACTNNDSTRIIP